MPINQITNTTPFNFDELYTELQTKFFEAGYDVAEGSNTSQLVTAMAYLTSMLNVNTAVNVNETLLPYATQRRNILSDARAIGYEIKHKTSYVYDITLSLGAENHSIQPFTEFTEGGHSYYYMGAPIEVVNSDGNDVITIPVKEGTLHKYVDNQDSLIVTIGTIVDDLGNTVPQYYVDIPLTDVEENGIITYLTYYDNIGNLVTREEWSKSPQILVDAETTLARQYVRLDNIDVGTPRLYFKIAGVGADLREGTIVEMNVLTTNGELGAMSDITNLQGIKHNIPNATITDCALVTPGTAEESLLSIKANAPKINNSANRAVTKIDYEAICNRQTSVDTSIVWGGDDEFPKAPGHIWFSFLPLLERNTTPTNIGANNNFVPFNSTLFSITRDNTTLVNWDYTLDPIADSVAYESQVTATQALYDTLYIREGNIRSFDYGSDGKLITPGIWDELDKYKIPTLEFHNRAPLYMDFDFQITIPKYNIGTPKATVHKNVFTAIDSFFNGVGDVLKMEQFEVEYFGSSLERRIDTVLADTTGFDMATTTQILLSKFNVSREIYPREYRDIYIPLAAPFENYFDVGGNLVASVLPSIDTRDFIQYGVETGANLFTDWDGLNGANLVNKTVIVAPIRITQSETVTPGLNATTATFTNIAILPDDPTMVDFGDPIAGYTFNHVTVTLNTTPGGIPTPLVIPYDVNAGVDTWSYDPLFPRQITLNLGTPLTATDTIDVSTNMFAGTYNLFNGFKKSILINLHVNATGWVDNTELEISNPKSYLTTPIGGAEYTFGNTYVTSNGYNLTSTAQVNNLTSDVVKRISTSLYDYTPIKMDLFNKLRYLNVRYNTLNFAANGAVVPRFKSLTFFQGY